jgi:CheY-like chemotaxis protein
MVDAIELRILHADDDDADLQLMSHVMSQLGLDVIMQQVKSGRGVIDYLRGAGKYRDRSRYGVPHLLLLDLRMPGLDGFEVLRWIRAQPEMRRLVVIVFSVSNREADVREAYELGANSYVVKPEALEDHVKFVRALQTWWLELNQFATFGSERRCPYAKAA